MERFLRLFNNGKHKAKVLVLTIIGWGMAMAYATGGLDQTITLSPGQQDFVVVLKSNPTTGYSWMLRQFDEKVLAMTGHRYRPSTSTLVGAGGSEVWNFHVKSHRFSNTRLYFVYHRPWEPLPKTSTVITVIRAPSKPA